MKPRVSLHTVYDHETGWIGHVVLTLKSTEKATVLVVDARLNGRPMPTPLHSKMLGRVI